MIFRCILFSFRSTSLLVSIPSFPDLQPKLREHDGEVSRCHSGKAVSSTCWVLSHRHRMLSYHRRKIITSFFECNYELRYHQFKYDLDPHDCEHLVFLSFIWLPCFLLFFILLSSVVRTTARLRTMHRTALLPSLDP